MNQNIDIRKAEKLYYKVKRHYNMHEDDWEQAWFDELEKLDTETARVDAHLFYTDDDTKDEIVAGIIDDIKGQTILQATQFFDESLDTLAVVYIIKK